MSERVMSSLNHQFTGYAELLQERENPGELPILKHLEPGDSV